MSDRSSGENLLGQSWCAFVRRLGAAVAALTALLSLFHDVPVRIACLRGGLALLAVLLVAKVGSWAQEKTWIAERLETPKREVADEGTP